MVTPVTDFTSTDGQPHLFLFADLCGFTALTEAHGDFEAAELVGPSTRSYAACFQPIAVRRSRPSVTPS